MNTIITKDEHIMNSPVYIGFLILKELSKKDDGKITIFETISKLKTELGLIHYRQLVFGLIFLYMNNIIDFSNPYIYKK